MGNYLDINKDLLCKLKLHTVNFDENFSLYCSNCGKKLEVKSLSNK